MRNGRSARAGDPRRDRIGRRRRQARRGARRARASRRPRRRDPDPADRRGVASAMRIDVFTIFPGPRRAPRQSLLGKAIEAGVLDVWCTTARSDRRPASHGRRRAVRRWPRHGDEAGRRGSGRRVARSRPRTHAPALARRTPARPGVRRRAGGRAPPHVALRTLRGSGRACGRGPARGGGLDRRLRALGRRAGGAGRDRGRDAARPGCHRRRSRSSGTRSRIRACSTTRTTRPASSAAWSCPTSWSRATTRRSSGGGRGARGQDPSEPARLVARTGSDRPG